MEKDALRQVDCKFHSSINIYKVLGYIYETDQYPDMDKFLYQCTIAGPSRLLMLSFTISNTIKNKKWALQVIDSVKLYL